MSEEPIKSKSKLREILSEDGSDYLSAGRVGLFICLGFSMAFSLLGLHYSSSTVVLNYCSLIALQFLGTGVIFYGSSKTSEAFKAKWLPDPVASNSTVSSVVSTVVNKVTELQKAKEEPKKEEEKPDLEDVK